MYAGYLLTMYNTSLSFVNDPVRATLHPFGVKDDGYVSDGGQAQGPMPSR